MRTEDGELLRDGVARLRREPCHTKVRVTATSRRAIPLIAAAAAGLVAPVFALSAIASPASAALPKLPDPCALAPPKLVAPALGAKVAPKGSLSESATDKVTEEKCTWVYAKVTLSVEIEPYQPLGGFGGPPGMVVERKPAGLGPDGLFTYDRNPKYLFSNATFAKGAYSGHVYSNGPDSPSSVLTLARAVYSAIP